MRLALPAQVELRVFDTRGSVDGARRAGSSAAGYRPDIIIGPAEADEARVISASSPILTFSNDETLAASGIHALGVTATQSTNSVLAYARGAGVKTIGIVQSSSAWSQRCEAAAVSAAAAIGLVIASRVDLTSADLVESLRAAGDGQLPNAVFVPDGGAILARVAQPLRAAGIQLLGTSQWSPADGSLPATAGAWIATADPRASTKFAEAYRQQYGETPGMLAGLAYDAALAAVILARAGRISTAGLSRVEGFSGVTGMFRFLNAARPERRLAILVAALDGARPVAGEAMPWA